jgi:hypothetical protein
MVVLKRAARRSSRRVRPRRPAGRADSPARQNQNWTVSMRTIAAMAVS